MLLNDAVSALLAFVQSGEGIPIELKVTPSDEVQQLRQRITEFESSLKLWQEKYDVLNYKYRNERQIVERLLDLCRDNDVRIPRDVFKR